MGDILFGLCYFICALTGATVTYPNGLIPVPLRGSSGICTYSIWNDTNEPGNATLATIRIADGQQSIIGQFVSAITDNPIVLFFVIMFAVFIGVKLLRRLCDA